VLSLGIQAGLCCRPSDFILQPYQEKKPLQVQLRAGTGSSGVEETLQKEKLVVHVGSARCRQEVLVSAAIVRPSYVLQLEGHDGCISQDQVIRLAPLQPTQQRQLMFTIRNTGV
jgi:hypothetical protein